MPQQEEQRMISAIRSGDGAAFAQLICRYERLVLHIVTPLIPGDHDRADLCQDIFIKVYEQLHRFEFRAKLATWIGQIAYNTAVNFLRRKKPLLLEDILRAPGAGDEGGFDEPLAELVPDAERQPDERLIRKQSDALLQGYVERLPPLQKTVLRLFHSDDLTLEEIGLILGLPLNTVKSHLFRARVRLKQILLNQSQLKL